MKPRGSVARYRSAASEHLEWCDSVGIRVLGGRWDLEDPITGLLLAAVVDPRSASPLLTALCHLEVQTDLEVEEVWWPSSYVDMIINFRVDGRRHMLALEHKHLNSPSNAPGYRKVGGGAYWQTESFVRELERVREAGGGELLGGPFRADAQAHLVVLDARGRTMDEAFKLTVSDEPHRHELWRVLSYADLARSLRTRYDAVNVDALEPILGQLFASERQ